MVIHEHKTVFIHIPKAAGVAITHMLLQPIVGYDTTQEIGGLSVPLKLRFELRGKQKHKQARYYTVDDDITYQQWREYYKFAVVRNPWDRVVSEFFWRHTLPTRRPSIRLAKFIDYCEARIRDRRNRARDIYWPHAQLQESFITDAAGYVIVDDVFRFEDLESVVCELKERTGLPLSLQKLNDSCHDDYRQYYDKATRDRVGQLYAKDIARFGYEF